MRFVLAAAVVITLAGCGRVGLPQPPFVRIPEQVHDFSAVQSGYNVVLGWTNPAHNIDGSPADNLWRAEITSNAGAVATLDATGRGKAQSYVVPARDWVGTNRTFVLRVETNRDKYSKPATASVTPLNVPGAVSGLRAVVDQGTITVEWEAPKDATGFEVGYQIQRTDKLDATQFTSNRVFKDADFDPGKTYTYVVTAARRQGDSWIMGVDSQQKAVEAIDRTPPKAPTELRGVVSESTAGVFLTWAVNEETDLAGYHVFRSDGPNSSFHAVGPDLLTSSSFFDSNYHAGFRYRVSAVDESQNESGPSAIVEP